MFEEPYENGYILSKKNKNYLYEMRYMKKRPLLFFVACFTSFANFACFARDVVSLKKYKVLVLWNYQGEYEWAKRLQCAGERLGWEVQLSLSSSKTLALFDKPEQEAIKKTYPPQYMIDSFKPDFTISLKDDKTFTGKIPNYYVLDVMWEGFFKKNILAFDGLLHCFPIETFLKPYIEATGKKYYGIDWYPSCPATEYHEIEPKKIFFCGFLWDKKRDGDEYKKLFTLLDQWDWLYVCGPQEKWAFVPNAYKGLLPYDGKSIAHALADTGVSLIIHSHYHLISGAPSARIFESAAAGAVIISDKHSFILREFGDSVLYIDNDATAEELFAQIRKHMDWIFSHPQEARLKAKKAHEIFIEKFTLEKQLLNLAAMHEQVMREKVDLN
jgi:hypothetical protein